MAQATFSIRMDEKLKKEFDALCTEFGMNATTAFNVFARAVVRERRIPFEIVSPAAQQTENEKYAFRIWLLRLGMNGDEYKQTRKVLMKNLTGHAAFRTPEAAAVAKEKAIKKREEEREQQA